jgi:hypothetical protein
MTMKLRNLFIMISAVLCMLLVGCGAIDYPTYTYEFTNGLGETYLVNYYEQVNYPNNNTHVKVFIGKNKISDYDGGAYTGCNSYTPSQVMLICKKDKVDYYYLRTQLAEYIVADGVSNIRMNYNMMKLGMSDAEMDDFQKRTYAKLGVILRSSITADAVQGKFDACGYNSGSLMQLYNYYRKS